MSDLTSAFDLLDGDINGRGLRSLNEELLTMSVSVKKQMDAGLGREDFAVAERVLHSIETAKEALSAVYDKMVG